MALIQMNNPKAMNALEDELSAELLSAYQDVAADPDIGAVILTGAERAFCAGGDLKKLSKGFPTAEAGYDYMKSFRAMVTTFMNMPKPTIAAVNGFAVGAGFCIAMQADLILASDKAKFGMAFANVGLIPDLAGMYTLPRLVGLQRAKELIFTGRTIGAEEARDMGIVNRVVPHDELLSDAKKLAKQLADGPRVALRDGQECDQRLHQHDPGAAPGSGAPRPVHLLPERGSQDRRGRLLQKGKAHIPRADKHLSTASHKGQPD